MRCQVKSAKRIYEHRSSFHQTPTKSAKRTLATGIIIAFHYCEGCKEQPNAAAMQCHHVESLLVKVIWLYAFILLRQRLITFRRTKLGKSVDVQQVLNILLDLFRRSSGKAKDFQALGENTKYIAIHENKEQRLQTKNNSHTETAQNAFHDQLYNLHEILSSLVVTEPSIEPQNIQPLVYVVACYPINQNPILPLTLQQKLDEMGPQEFLNYVLKDLTLRERESLMVDEGQRRKTFQVNWPYSGNLSGVRMAQAGFYYVDDPDRVQCVFCRGSLHRWSKEDIPMKEHAKAFSFCRFVKGMECGNRKYSSKMLTNDDLVNITTFTNNNEINNDSLGICTNRAAVIQYAPDSVRLRTYTRWPESNRITAEQLCDAGFYYTGFDDQVRCFYCDGRLTQWADGDDPWKEHARWFPGCSYLLNKKGKDYVDDVHRRTPDNKKCTRKTVAEKKAQRQKELFMTTQEEMRIVCQKLGHSAEDIDRVLVINGKPFDNVKDMIEALYSLESDDNEELSAHTARKTNFVTSAQPPPAQQAMSQPTEDGVMLDCLNCELNSGIHADATHVGLPCGHLIYCESCNEDEQRKSSTQQPKCPQCSASLTGTIKVYLA